MSVSCPNKHFPQQDENKSAHFLIGIPGSGKSTFAGLISQFGCEIISTDDIRQELYGDAAIQGDWCQIESEAIYRICTVWKAGKSVVYDATNFKRAFRMDFLRKLNFKGDWGESSYPDWIAWYLNTPLETCIARNQKRDRKVPENIIESMYVAIVDFPPITAEGFAAVNIVDAASSKFSSEEIKKLIQKLPRSIINSNNRTVQKH